MKEKKKDDYYLRVSTELLVSLVFLSILAYLFPKDLDDPISMQRSIVLGIGIIVHWTLCIHISWLVITEGLCRIGRKMATFGKAFGSFSFQRKDMACVDPPSSDALDLSIGKLGRSFLVLQLILAVFAFGALLHILYNPLITSIFGKGAPLPPMYFFSSVWPIGAFIIIFIIDMDLKMGGERLTPGIVWRIGKISIASYSTGTFCMLARYFFYWSPERVKDSFVDSLDLFLAFLVFNALFSLAFYLVYKKAVNKAGKNLSGGK